MAERRGPFRRLASELRRVIRPEESRAHQLFHDRLLVLGVLTLVVGLAASVAMLLLERHASGTNIHNAWQAAYWTASAMTAIGSSYANPITPAAHVLDLVLKLYAIVVVASLTGAVGAFFIHRKDDEQAA
jgi:hypothetical protein